MQKYYLITTYYNRKVINKYNIFTIMIIKQTDILTKIRNIILASGYSDVELSEKSGLSKEGIYKIRSGKTTSIRSSNAKNILKVLDYSLESSLDGLKIVNLLKPVQFKGLNKVLKKTDNASDTLNLLNTQSATINTFIQQINEKDELLKLKELEIQEYKKRLKDKDELLLQNSVILPTLDQSKMQIIVEITKNQKFIDMTTLYSQYLGYEPFELLGENYLTVVHEDEYERVKYLEENTNETKKINSWKMKKKDGSPCYIKSNFKMITKGKIIIAVVDIDSLTEEEYLVETSESYYTPTKGSA